jgi:hypothetical protein
LELFLLLDATFSSVLHLLNKEKLEENCNEMILKSRFSGLFYYFDATFSITKHLFKEPELKENCNETFPFN